MKLDFFRAIAILLLLIVLSSCGNPPATPPATETQAASTPTIPTPSLVATDSSTSTPDPCSMPQLETEVQKVHNHMREFDDSAKLANFIPRQQLGDSIAELQRIRREAEDERVPSCLTNLKTYQVTHMNTVIDTLILFLRSGNPQDFDCVDIKSNTDEESFCKGIAFARQLHDEYVLELARVLGLTAVAATLPPAASETPTP